MKYGERKNLTVRLPSELHDHLKMVAAEREIGVNVLAVAAITSYLRDLRPVEELLRAASK